MVWPHGISRTLHYVVSLNSDLNNNRENINYSRLLLLKGLSTVIINGMNILGVSTPDKM